MKKSLLIIGLVLVLFVGVTFGVSKLAELGAGDKTLADKTPKELYSDTIKYIKGLTNYEIVVDTTYKYEYTPEGETDENGETLEPQEPVEQEEKQTSVYKGADKTVCYSFESEITKEHVIYDGTTVYQFLNGVKEKKNISYDDLVKEYGSFVESGMLLELPDSNFENVLFVKDGDLYVLNLKITPKQYEELMGGYVENDIAYNIYFNEDGIIQKFERCMEYYYYEILMFNTMTATFKNIGTTEKITAPEDADLYALRPLESDIDMTPVENLDGFKETACRETT